MRRKIIGSALSATTAIVATLTTCAHAGADTVAATIPLAITNHSGINDIFLYDFGISGAKMGWADRNGLFTTWVSPAKDGTPIPDGVAIKGPASGQSLTIQVPKANGGRIYYAYGKPLEFKLNRGPGLVQPSIDNESDPNIDTLYNFTEYTNNDNGLWINSTQVDMFSAPYTVSATGTDGVTKATGALEPGGYHAVFDDLRAHGWDNLIQTRPDGTVLRAVAPRTGYKKLPADVDITRDIDAVWDKYSQEPLYVTVNEATYIGRVDTAPTDPTRRKLSFTTPGNTVETTAFTKPTPAEVYACSGGLGGAPAPRGPIAAVLCAAFNRSTLANHANQPDNNVADFFKDGTINRYAESVHKHMLDGKAYAFAYDDVGNHESLVQIPHPRSAQITLDTMD
ncbi:beta-1,3-glucanase family protein [Rhodococcus jostii]|uniref:beta-1,3-glucanase family protein n=1 Tax=Rhodococcus jostii TaxID=132919 RepID=UPI0036251E05